MAVQTNRARHQRFKMIRRVGSSDGKLGYVVALINCLRFSSLNATSITNLSSTQVTVHE